MKWYVYMLRCSDRTLYTGITNDLDRRVKEHNSNNKLAAAYTRGRRPVNLVYHEICGNRSEALKREAEIRKMNRSEKEILLDRN